MYCQIFKNSNGALDQTRLKPFLKVKSSHGLGGGQRQPLSDQTIMKPKFHEHLSVPAHMHECKVLVLVQSICPGHLVESLIRVQRSTFWKSTCFYNILEFGHL